MSEPTLQDLARVAEDYEAMLAPALFGQWGERMADVAAVGPGQHVLDVACGTGLLARAMASRVAPGGSVTGLDLNPGMLAVARRLAPAIDWREGPAEALPFDDNRFDAVVSQFGLMLFADPASAMREMQRVLKPGGHLAVAVFDALDRMPAYAAMADVYERVVGPGVGAALRFPFSMGDPDALAALSARAGIGNAVVTTRGGAAHFADARHMVLADVKGWFPFAGIHLDERAIDGVTSAAEKALSPFLTADGAVEFAVPVQIVTATKA